MESWLRHLRCSGGLIIRRFGDFYLGFGGEGQRTNTIFTVATNNKQELDS